MRYVIPKSFLESDITDEQGQPVFHVDSPILSLLDTLLTRTAPLIVRDMVGTEVVRVKRANSRYALHATYRITRQGEVVRRHEASRTVAITREPSLQYEPAPSEEVAEIRQKEIGPAGPFTIDIPGLHDLQMTGSLFEHEYTITRDDQVVATVSKRWLSLTDTYAVLPRLACFGCTVDIADLRPVTAYGLPVGGGGVSCGTMERQEVFPCVM